MKRIAVIGDAMVDVRRFGYSSRMSPEDPHCQVLSRLSTVTELGGAANVAYWLAAQPENNITLFSHYGMDEAGFNLNMLCRRSNIHLSDLLLRRRGDYHTTSKERICLVDDHGVKFQQLVRCDLDTNCTLAEIEQKLLRQALLSERFDAIVVADYRKGVFLENPGERLRDVIGTEFKGPVIVNSKCPSDWQSDSISALICNENEHLQMWSQTTDNLDRCGKESACFIITKGKLGVTCNLLMDPNSTHRTIWSEPSLADTVIDVTGAGDAFTAGFANEYLRRPQLAAHAMHEESEIRSCIHQGQRWAAHCCSQIGCGIPIMSDRPVAREEGTKEMNHVVTAQRVEVG